MMLWILVVQCLIGAILAIGVGGSDYRKTHKFSPLVICCCGLGLFAFTCMIATISVFLK